ncbi:hypothetical protein IMZ48_32990 [Candidatus Bathyarchaeota archaeon]|nr:hypothetical protein [Candidatus Bathyarchaeota archaeon]
MVALSISTTQPPENKAARMPIWYPQIPPRTVETHPKFALAQDSKLFDNYQPLSWTPFGGTEGQYLRNLTSISSPAKSHSVILKFKFNSDAVPPECRRLAGDMRRDCPETTSFAIDGPGGEMICEVEVTLANYFYDSEAMSRDWCVFGLKVREPSSPFRS